MRVASSYSIGVIPLEAMRSSCSAAAESVDLGVLNTCIVVVARTRGATDAIPPVDGDQHITAGSMASATTDRRFMAIR